MTVLARVHTELLTAISDLSFTRDIPTLTGIVRRVARRLTAADGVTFVLRDGDQCFYADEDAIAPLWKGRRFPMSACISGLAMTQGVTIAIPDIYQDDRVPHDAYRPTFVKSMLMVPVRPEDAVAAIGAYWARPFDPPDEVRQILEALARASSLALSNIALWEQLQASLAREREANQLKDQFLATVSHELRTPLNVMQGVVWQLQRPDMPAERVPHAIAMLARNTSLQARLVQDLLDLTAAVGGDLHIDARLIDVSGPVHAALEASRASAEQKGVTLVVTPADPAPLVLADPDRLQQIVLNLLANAIRFTPAAGRVTVTVGRRANKAVIEIVDTGIGIAPELLPRVFDRFRQGDAGPTRQHGGLGIGLAIVEQLVRLHGGTVSAHSAGAGQGTLILVELPVPALRAEPAEWRKRRASDRPVRQSLEGSVILVVDDEPDACEALRSILEYHGATVFQAGSAEEAMQVLNAVSPTLILTDLSMPGTDGYQFLSLLRGRKDRAATVPAAVLTALTGDEQERLARAAGFVTFLRKPIYPNVLAAELARLSAARAN